VASFPFEIIAVLAGFKLDASSLGLLKMPRLARLGRLVRKLEKTFSGLIFRVCKLLITVFFLSHIIGCTFYFVGVLPENEAGPGIPWPTYYHKMDAAPEQQWHLWGIWMKMARYLAAQFAVEDALHHQSWTVGGHQTVIFRCGTQCGARLAALAGGIIRSGYPHCRPWLTDGTEGTSKNHKQGVWMEPKVTQPKRRPFHEELYDAVRYQAMMCASRQDDDQPFMDKREFLSSVIDLANSIVKDTHKFVTPAAVRSAAALAAAAPVDPNVQSAKKRRRDGTGVEESADEGYYGDMVPFYRAVLYPQDGNQDAGGLTFSLAHMHGRSMR
jgi:hypothetical protein